VKENFIKAIVLTSLAVAWCIGYAQINAFNSDANRALFLTMRPVDYWEGIIQPSSAIVYVIGAAVLLVWPIFLTWSSSEIWQFTRMVVMGTIVGFSIFILWPLNIRRPEFIGDRFGESIMQAVFTVDEPANCFPSFHSFFAVLGALVVQQQVSSKLYVGLAWLIAVGVLVSAVMTGQHYCIDVLGGSILALVCFGLLRSRRDRSKRRFTFTKNNSSRLGRNESVRRRR